MSAFYEMFWACSCLRMRWQHTIKRILALLQVILPPHLTGRKMSDDHEIQKKYEDLWKVEDDIREGKLDIPPEGERSPSPPPVYDRFGIRQNTREFRYREKLLDERCNLIEELIKIDQTYQPPSDYRPRKKHKKIFIPYKEFPGYNFIGAVPATCRIERILQDCGFYGPIACMNV
jgi:splicing factor 1